MGGLCRRESQLAAGEGITRPCGGSHLGGDSIGKKPAINPLQYPVEKDYERIPLIAVDGGILSKVGFRRVFVSIELPLLILISPSVEEDQITFDLSSLKMLGLGARTLTLTHANVLREKSIVIFFDHFGVE